MVNLLRGSFGWFIRYGRRVAINSVMRHGGRVALDTALSLGRRAAVGSALAPVASPSRSHTQVFNVAPPVTVYVRASHCRVTVRQHRAPKVMLEANLYRAFGVDLTAEQDGAGVYIIARRKAVVGTVARLDFTLTVPAGSHLALNLTPGEVIFDHVNGMIELPIEQVFLTDDAS
jgi:hypothetical protein